MKTRTLILSLFILFTTAGCGELGELKELLNDLKAENERLLTELELLNSRLDEYDTKLTVILASLEDNAEEMQALQEKVDSLTAQLIEQLAKIDALKDQLDQQGADIDQLTAEIQALKDKCDELKALIEKLLEGKSPIPTEGLVAWYPFNGNADDESGNGNDGVVNGATLTSDRDGNENSSYSFDGVTSSISSSENFSFNNELTFSSWIYIESYIEDGVHRRIVNSSEGTGGISDRWMFNVSPNSESSTLQFNIGIGNEVQGLKTIPLNKFTHVAFTFKNGEVVIYMDGEIDSSSTLDITNLNFINAPIDLGSVKGLESFFNGKIDDIGIWERALTAEEITKIYNGDKF